MSRRRVKPVEKGHLFAVLVVIINSICCEAASDADISQNIQNISSAGSSARVIQKYSCSNFERFCRPEQVCLPLSFNCDFDIDCSDGSDESECIRILTAQSKCDDDSFYHCEHSQRCIPKRWVCDGDYDCGSIAELGFIDDSDEDQNCTIKCPPNESQCSNGKCLPISKFCDGHVDCSDDEAACYENQCKNLKCDYDCRMTPMGAKCFCPSGQIPENITKCAQLKSCREETCDQLCSVVNGGEVCTCLPGYSWETKLKKCVSDASSTRRMFLLSSQQLSEIELKANDEKGSSTIKVNFTSAYDMEINYANNTLCVLERSEITCFNVTNFQQSWKLPQPDFLPISDKTSKLFISNFAIDWISNNFYLVDSEHHIIILCNSKMEHCRTVVSSLGNANIKFQDIAIDPTEGFIFMSKFNRSSRVRTEILRFLMDGSDKLSLFSEKLFYPKDLTLDVAMKRIYFLDNSLEFIQESDYNGKNRKFLKKLPPKKFQRIVFYENTFYALNGSTSSLIQIDKSTNRIETHSITAKAKSLRIFAPQIQPKLSSNNICSVNSSDENSQPVCDQLCVPMRIENSSTATTTHITAKCLCSEGFDLKDGNKCVLRSAKKLLFFFQKNPQTLRAIDVENVEMKVIAPIVGLEAEVAFDVDMRNRRIYFTSHTSYSTNHNGTDFIEYRSFDGKERGVLNGNFGEIQSMAYDWKGKNIYFSAGSPRSKIVVVRVDRPSESSIMRTLISKNIIGPSSIALNLDDGVMFWASFTNENNIGGKIEMAWLDGSSRSLLASKDTHKDHQIYWPVSLNYHRELNKLFWLDVLTQRINSLTLGENRIIKQIYIETHSYSLTVLGNQFLWTDNTKDILLIADMDNNVNLTRRTTLLQPNDKVFLLKSYVDDNSKDVENQLQLNCPGIFFTLPTDVVCLCGDGYSKNGLGNSCIKNTIPTTLQKKINCSDVQFACKSLDECINRDFVCDGFKDCSDGSDEELSPTGPCAIICNFKCDDSRCLEKHQVCDGVPDCTDGRDESDDECATEADINFFDDDYCDEFLCVNNQCISFDQYCDGIDNCGDNSDELDCPNVNRTFSPFDYEEYDDDIKDIKFILEYDSMSCKMPELYCEKDRKCITIHQLCDGKHDCTDGSDEGGKCGEKVCDVYSECQFFCQNTPTSVGATCYCPEHLVLDNDGKSCISPQICEEFSCSHICETLSLKKTRCRCSFGYQLKEDNFTCESMDKKEPILMFSSRQIIKGVKLDRKHSEVKNYYLKGRNIIGLDFYFDQVTKDYVLFWSDITSDKIFSGVVANDEIVNPKPIVESHLSQVESVAVDWIGKNLYWVDSTLKHIDVTTKEGMHRATLISEDISKPRSLAIDSRFAYLFWSDWEEENPRIERATLAGEDRKSIFNISSKAGGWANGITLDFVKQRIFYVDAKTKEIHTIDYDGENFKRIIRDTEYLQHPYAVTIYENNLYWSDWRRQGIIRADKFSANNIDIFLNSSSQLFDVKLIHSSRQPIDFNGEGKSKSISSPCDKSKCSHLCLLSTSTTFKCHCPRMMRLKSNSNETCENINKVIFYITENQSSIQGLDLDFPNSSSVLTIYDTTKIISPVIFDIHPIDMRIFWFDENLREVKSMKLATPISPMPENIEIILDSEVFSFNTFAIDWTSNLMFFVQREGIAEDFVEFVLFACNTRGEYWTLILEDQQEISSLVVAPKRRKLYFVTSNTTEDSKKYFIQEVNYDGTSLKTVFTEDEEIQNLIMDHDTSTLYFVKNHLKIFSFNLDTKDTQLINTFYGEGKENLDFFITKIALSNEDLYFHENKTNSLRRCNKHICDDPIIFRKNLNNLRQFSINQFNIVPKNDDYSSNNKCYKNNQNGVDNKVCEHLCMPKKSDGGSSSNFVCKCAMGYKADEKFSMACVPAVDSIIYSHDHEMASVSAEENDDIKFPPLQHINTISYFDVDTRRDLIYIADNERGEIYRVKRDGSSRESILLPPEGYEHNQYEWFSGLAIDWIAENLYFSDKSKGIIEIVALAGRYRHVLLSQINKPSQINIDPVHGILFFIDGNNNIKRHDLNSSSRDIFAVKTVSGTETISNIINDFVLDIENRKVYVCESRTNSLWQIDYDGGNHKEIKDSLINNWISIDVLDGKIFWTERAKNEINSMSLSSLGQSTLPKVEKINVNSRIRKLRMMSIKRQFGSNVCASRKGNCSEICLSDGNGINVKCLCSTGRLSDDKRTCRSYGNYLFFSSENQFEKQGLDHILEHPKIENSTFLHHAVAMTYDFESQIIFYSDIILNGIFSCNFNGNNFTKLIDHQASVEGITWNSQNNELFWTMNKDAEIRSKRLNSPTTPVNTILKMKADVDKLRAIAAEPCLGMLYFSNWNKRNPTISRIFNTGYSKENVITTNIVMPNALTLDLEEKLLFWADAKLDKLERCNYDGRNRVVLTESTPKHPFALTVFKEFIYWTDWTLRGVLRTNKFSGNDAIYVAANIAHQPLGLFVAQPSMKKCTNNICSGLRSGCEDACLPKGDHNFVCECTRGFLDIDGKRCLSRVKTSQQPCNKSLEFECKSGECIPYTLTCDGISHCSDNSDEIVTFCATRKCPSENFYQCRDARCIDKNEKCDGKNDCKSGEDEEECEKPECKNDEFKCKNGDCVIKAFQCDYRPDCLDASDEINCENRTCSKSLLKTIVGIDVSRLIPCNRTTNCYLKEWVCDGQNDCWDWSDERNCNKQTATNGTCPPGFFHCSNHDCILMQFVCDGVNDCEDLEPSTETLTDATRHKSSDEMDCHAKTCTENQFICEKSKACIPLELVCDGNNDCPDENETDEICKVEPISIVPRPSCLSTEDSCLSGECIPKHFFCDGKFDCDDQSDETEVCLFDFTEKPPPCELDEFACKDKTCIKLSKICDLQPDCPDDSDENMTLCLSYPAYCKQSNDRYLCSHGGCINASLICNGADDCGDFSDEMSCNINECLFTSCGENADCQDLKIGMECECRTGFVANINNSMLCDDIDECETRPCSQICSNTPGSYSCHCIDDFIREGHRCRANSKEHPKLLFATQYYIKTVDFTGHSEILVHNLTDAVAIDFDWDRKYIYYSDGSKLRRKISRVRVGDKTSHEPEILHRDGLKSPDGIAFDFVAMNLYWCDKGQKTIEVSKDNGKYRKVLIKSKLDNPRALVLNPFQRYIYWTDWGLSPHIGRAGMDGSNPEVIVSGNLGWPNALTISFETNELFFGDAKEDFISLCNLDGKNRKVVAHRRITPSINHIFAIATWDEKVFFSDWETTSIEFCDKYSGLNCGTLMKLGYRPFDIKLYHPFRQQKLRTTNTTAITKPSWEKKKDKDHRHYKKKVDILSNVKDNPCISANCSSLCLLSPNPPYYQCQCPDFFYLDKDQTSCIANCTASQFHCKKSLRCIPFFWKCDGQADCDSAEDEPANCPPFSCQAGEFQCDYDKSTKNATCLEPIQVCDGKRQCKDGKDEENCDVYGCFIESQFQCEKTQNSSAYCIPNKSRCDSLVDCPSGNDEIGCPEKSCPSWKFQCESKEACLPKVWLCDGDRDCTDGSDEKNCKTKECFVNEFRCPNGRCIPFSWLCDSEKDCPDGSDEGEKASCDVSTLSNSCDPTYFKCTSGKCIPGRFKCDKVSDCDDSSDEEDCPHITCAESDFRCSDGQCINGSLHCNGHSDCNDFSDELDCESTAEGQCLNQSYVCDGIYDCADGRDEKNCGCLMNEFKCSGNFEKCIPSDWLCDGYFDCPDRSDEHDSRCLKRGCAGNAVKCKSGKCVPEHLKCECDDSIIRNCTKKSAESFNKKICKFGTCSQLCNEKKYKDSNYSCKCAEGYHKLEHMKNSTCVVNDTHFLTMTAFRSDLSFFPTLDEARKENQLSSHSYLISNLPKVISFDYAIVNESLSIFVLNSFPSNALEKIDLTVSEYRNFNYTKIKSTFLIEQSKKVILKALSVDWITAKVYYIVDDLIKAMEMDGSKVRTIIDAGVKAWDIIVDPSNSRQIFWSTAMREIQVASMDGSRRQTFLKKDIEFVYGLAIDSPARRLYWCDIKRSTIEAINLDGSGRQLVSKFKIHDKIYDLPINPIKLDVFEDKIYFVMTDNHLYTMNKFGHDNGTFTIVKHANYTIRASHVKIIHAVRQNPVKLNPCVANPCDKSAICYLSSTDPSGRSCNCPDNNFIQKNGSYVECLEKAKNPSLCYKKCANDGKCKFESEQMICECNPRFEGEFCESYICSGYCKNHGICVLVSQSSSMDSHSTSELKAKRKCICKEGWEGDTCDVRKRECNTTTCLNGGTCHVSVTDGETKEMCICPMNFSGSKCQNCDAKQCFNGGTCTLSSDVYKCSCPSGYAGLNCEIDKCRDYCLNNGICSVDAASSDHPKCECPFNFKGDKCEIDYRCENCGADSHNCTIHCHNGGRCIKDETHHTEVCECDGEWKGIACNMLTCLNGECGKCRENSPIESCLCDDGSTQTCLPSEDSLYHQDVTATEVPNENFKTLIVIIIAALVSVFVFVLIFASIIYVQRWQTRRFFNFSHLNENVEEITNPIFDLSGGGDDVMMPVTNVLSQGHFGNPLYDTMYATHSRKGLLEKKSDDEDEFKSDLL